MHAFCIAKTTYVIQGASEQINRAKIPRLESTEPEGSCGTQYQLDTPILDGELAQRFLSTSKPSAVLEVGMW